MESLCNKLDTKDDPFEQEYAEAGGEDTQDNIDDIMMPRIDRRTPYSYTDKSKQQDGGFVASAHNGIDGCDKHIGGMQGRYSRKDIGILPI